MSIAPLLSRDTCTAHRPLGGVDENGKPRTGHDSGMASTGTWGSAGSRDLELAGRMDVQVSAVYATPENLKKNYLLRNLRGRDWLVTHVRPIHTHNRCFLVEWHG